MRKALVIVLAAGVARMIIAASTPLFPDETYYWDWSRHLAAGYFDHPPMIAWLIRAGTSLAGHTALGVRAGAVLAGIVAALIICATAQRMGGPRAAVLAAVIFAVMPLSAAGLILATPDAPLLAFASATVYALVRALDFPGGSRQSLPWWGAAGLSLGLALNSKYTAVLLPLGVFAAFLVQRHMRKRLADPGPYVATAIALLVFLPVIVWNARHDWASFAFQLGHGFGGVSGSVIKRELDLVGGQLGLVSPILFVMMAIAVGRALRAPGPDHPSFSHRYALAVASIAIFAFFAYSATRRGVEANWPALAYVPAVLLLANHLGSRTWDRWLRGGIALAVGLTAVVYVNAFFPILPVPARRDPAARAAGWEDLALAVERIDVVRRPISSYRTWIAAERYQETSELAFHMPERPEVFSLNLNTRANQYDLWPTITDRAHERDGLLLVLGDAEGIHPTIELLTPHFTTVTRGELVPLQRRGDIVRKYRIWILDGWLGTWPGRPLRSPT